MKKLLTVCLLVIYGQISSAQNSEQNKQYQFKIKEWASQVTGYTRGAISERSFESKTVDVDWETLHLALDIFNSKKTTPKIKFHSEFRVVDTNNVPEDWLVEANASYEWKNESYLKVGRIFTAAPLYTAPHLSALETARPPREPWGFYAYGIQFMGTTEDGWKLVADVSTVSGKKFRDGDNFDQAETSARLSKSFGKFTLGGEYQVSWDFKRFGMDFNYSPITRLHVNGEIYQAWEKNDDLYGGYVLGRYDLTKHLSPHIMIDHQSSGVRGNDTKFVAGIMFHTAHDHVRVIGDFEIHPGAPERNGAYGVLQIRY